MAIKICRPRSLPPDRLELAARRAVEINPSNRAARRTVEVVEEGRRGGPRRLAVVVDKKWPASGVRLTVSFLDNPSQALRSRILLHMNAWSKSANVRFSETKGLGPGADRAPGRRRLLVAGRHGHSRRGRRPADAQPRRLHHEDQRVGVSPRRPSRGGAYPGLRPRTPAHGHREADHQEEGVRVLREARALVAVGSGRSSPDAARGQVADGYDRSRSALDHVLRPARLDHEGREARDRRQRHQRQRFRVRREDLPEEEEGRGGGDRRVRRWWSRPRRPGTRTSTPSIS